ncbi:MAG: LD-carboxypeptidase [Candidatus Omnitrophota bacterium]
MTENNIIKPNPLKKGDTIGIVAPAWTFDVNTFKRGVDRLNSLGYKVKYDRSIFSKYWSMAGYDRQRAHQINRMFADNQVKAILCAQAGYGSMRTIPYLDAKVIRSNPKIFVGYSDITILLSYLFKTAGMVVFHGPVVSGEIYKGMNALTLKYLVQSLSGKHEPGRLSFPHLKALKPGKASGVLVGGNLSLILDSFGTPYEIDTDNKILFLEDIAEDLTVIDSHLMHLKLAGKFNKIRGIIFGRMIDCFDYSGKKYSIRDILNDILYDVDIPILYGFPSGHWRHGRKRDVNVTLPFGVNVSMYTHAPGIRIEEAGVDA